MRYVHRLLQQRPLQPFRIDYPGSPLYAQQKAAFCSSWDGEYLFWSVLGLILSYEADLPGPVMPVLL